MKKIEILEKRQRKKIINHLNEQFGIEDLQGILVRINDEKLFIFQGDYEKKEIYNLNNAAPIEKVGVYLGKTEDRKMRISIEGSQILKNQITKNIIELNEKEAETWMMGYELEKSTNKTGFVIVKYKEEMLGTGKASKNKITNFIPKSRKLRDRNIEN